MPASEDSTRNSGCPLMGKVFVHSSASAGNGRDAHASHNPRPIHIHRRMNPPRTREHSSSRSQTEIRLGSEPSFCFFTRHPPFAGSPVLQKSPSNHLEGHRSSLSWSHDV